MLVDEIADPDAVSPAEVRAEYEASLATIVEDVGVDTAAAETSVPETALETLRSGGEPELTVEQAAELLALSDAYPDADAFVLEIRDSVMLGMSSAVMDVDSMEANLPIDMEARDIQQKIEGRQDMTLAEYAHIAHHIATENPY